MSRRRLIGIIAVVIGVIVPIAIDKYETVNHLDISRDIGSLPWLIMTVIGVILVVSSFFQKKADRNGDS